jgi:spermidine synthase
MTALTPMTKMMVHLPLALHDGPSHNALIICFGMGTSYRSALSWGIKTTAVELIPSVPKEFGYFHTNAPDALNNPNGQIVIDDGRRFLERTRESFDLIVIDPPPPIEAAGSSLLYSKEFYDTAKRHLEKNGVLETWYPAGDPLTGVAIYNSLKESFPYIRCFHGMDGWGIHFLASMEPTKSLSPEEAAKRLPPLAQQDMLEWSSPTDAADFMGRTVAKEFGPEIFAGFDPRVVINDDHPFNEYFLLRNNRLLKY